MLVQWINLEEKITKIGWCGDVFLAFFYVLPGDVCVYKLYFFYARGCVTMVNHTPSILLAECIFFYYNFFFQVYPL